MDNRAAMGADLIRMEPLSLCTRQLLLLLLLLVWWRTWLGLVQFFFVCVVFSVCVAVLCGWL